MTPTRHVILGALASVHDPELGEPVTDLGFVEDVRIRAGDVRVALRLPTYFCAPNFAYMMVADATAAVSKVPGVRNVRIELVDHFSGQEISDSVARGESFATTFEGQATGELEDLRTLFNRKVFVSRQAALVDALPARERSSTKLADLTIADLPAGDATRHYLAQLERLGLDASPAAWVLVRANGERVPSDRIESYLRLARVTRVSIEGNAELCRGLLRTRYGFRAREKATA